MIYLLPNVFPFADFGRGGGGRVWQRYRGAIFRAVGGRVFIDFIRLSFRVGFCYDGGEEEELEVSGAAPAALFAISNR